MVSTHQLVIYTQTIHKIKKTKILLVHLLARILVLYCHVTKAMLVPDFALYHYEIAQIDGVITLHPPKI